MVSVHNFLSNNSWSFWIANAGSSDKSYGQQQREQRTWSSVYWSWRKLLDREERTRSAACCLPMPFVSCSCLTMQMLWWPFWLLYLSFLPHEIFRQSDEICWPVVLLDKEEVLMFSCQILVCVKNGWSQDRFQITFLSAGWHIFQLNLFHWGFFYSE